MSVITALANAVQAHKIRKTATWVDADPQFGGKRWEAEKVIASTAANEELVELLTVRHDRLVELLAEYDQAIKVRPRMQGLYAEGSYDEPDEISAELNESLADIADRLVGLLKESDE
jgi:hypothetical protein